MKCPKITRIPNRPQVSSSWTHCPPRQGHEVIYIKFRVPDCRECTAKSACTKAQRRTIAVQTQEIHDFLKQKRAFQETQDFRDLYRQRASVEGRFHKQLGCLGCVALVIEGLRRHIYKIS